jgi:Uncharacterized protein conserved in bacteria (DUF2059)
MKPDQKKDLARRLMDAKREGPRWKRWQPGEKGEEGPQSMLREVFRQSTELLHELLVDMHVEFLSEAELTAELEFWATDTGQSIIAKRRRMMRAFTERANAALADLNKSDGPLILAEYSENHSPSDDS